jgi:hypothetical protein
MANKKWEINADNLLKPKQEIVRRLDFLELVLLCCAEVVKKRQNGEELEDYLDQLTDAMLAAELVTKVED